MKRIYSCLRPIIDAKSYAEWFTKTDQKVTLSCRGLVAFTSSFCLNQRRPSSTSYHVYICDINSPYQPYLLMNSEHQITILEWDPSGKKLLLADISGNVVIYTSKDYLISDWKPYYKNTFAGETFLTSAWYHPGFIYSINIPPGHNLKKPSNHLEYTDKIRQCKYGASLRTFGGKPAEGCLLVSCSGLVCCLTLIADGTVDCISESLGPLRSRVLVADICHQKDGSFVIGTSIGEINSTISFYQISLSMKNLTMDDLDSSSDPDVKKVSISCRHFHSFHLNVMSQMLNERENSTTTFETVAHIKFVTKDSPNDVLVEVKGQNLSLIELWELETKKELPIHPAIAAFKKVNPSIAPTDVDKKINIDNIASSNRLSATETSVDSDLKEWTFKGNYIAEKDLVAIQTPKFELFGTNRQLHLILLAYKDNTICCMRKEDLQPMFEPLDLTSCIDSNSAQRNGKIRNNCDNNDISPNKWANNNKFRSSSKQSPNSTNKYQHQTNNVYLTDIQFSCNQSTVIAIDTMSQLHAVQLPPLINCVDDKDYEIYLQYLLEYCLVTGNDWWDVIVSAKHESLESICDEFHDAYERQPKNIQHMYFNKQLTIRASLYRCLNNVANLCKSSDCHTTIMLNSVSSTLRSMLRSQQSDQDSLADELSTILKTQPISVDLDHVLSKIKDPKDFNADPSVIQGLQPLIQWVGELAVYLVVSFPQRCQLPGSGLAQNKDTLETIRELLVIIKIWGSQNEASLPMVHQLTEKNDVVGKLFRLVSTIYASVGSEPEPSFVEECIQFSQTITIPNFCFLLNSTGVASPLLFAHRQQQKQQLNGEASTQTSTPLMFEYFRQPSQPELVKLPQVDGSINFNGDRKIDVVRNISLGAHPIGNLRMCTRCQSVSMIESETKRHWDQRWINSCVCGGSWAQSDTFFANKASYLAWHHNNPSVGAQNFVFPLTR